MAQPTPPTSIKVNGIDDDNTALVTRAVSGKVSVSAIVNDPDAGTQVRLVVRYSTNKNFPGYYTRFTTWGARGIRRTVTLDKLERNTQYYVRAYTQSRDGWFSGVNGATFWTDRYPEGPLLVAPDENATFQPGVNIPLDWQVVDPDDPDSQDNAGWQVIYRRPATPTTPAGPWVAITHNGTGTTSALISASAVRPSTNYEWCVRTKDPQGLWGTWSLIRSFSVGGVTTTPQPLGPGGDIAAVVDDDVVFRWRFRDPSTSATQGNADIRYRVIGTPTWITVLGTTLTDSEWTFPAGTFAPGYHYEWQVRTTRAAGADPVSEWSASARFWTILEPGSLANLDLPTGEKILGELGCGHYRVFVMDQGGLVRRGELTSISSVEWGRKRDDISTATVILDGWDENCATLLSKLRTWRYELKIVRVVEGQDDEEVWEGPITHLASVGEHFEISARDVMAYLYRRILRQGYNDGYHVVNGVQQGLKTVVQRAGIITRNALAYSDPNVLPYMTLWTTGNDARQSRIVPDYTKMAWEEIDDLAQNAGLDYTVSRRRITYWDTHQMIGLLPEMRDDDFSEPLIVTEYGASAANYFAVTDGQGAWGAAFAASLTEDNWSDFYGPLEQLASAYGDTSAAPAADPAELTPAALAELQRGLTEQARRNVNHRWPAPLVARVPDNSTLRPDLNIGINQLIPGVWIPLRITKNIRPFAQMQKLDSMTVTESAAEGEKIAVVLSPAPQASEDPDLAGEVIEESE